MATQGLIGLGMGLANMPQQIVQGQAAGRQQAFAEQAASDEADMRKLQRAEALRRKQMGDMELARMQKFQPAQDDVLQQQLQVQAMQLERQGTAMFKQNTYQALDKYFEDGNVRHLNAFVQEARQNPYAPQAFKDVARIDPVSPASPNMKQLLMDSGLTEQSLDEMDGTADGQIDWDVISQRFVTVTKPDGTQQITDLMQLGIMTGYGEYADDKKLNQLLRLADIKKAERGGASVGPTAAMQNSELIAQLEAKVRSGEATPEDQDRLRALKATVYGQGEAQFGMAQTAVDQFLDKGYMDLPYEQLRSNREAMRLVERVETEMALSEADKKVIRELMPQVSALRRAQNLSPEKVGMIDSRVAQLWKKISESAEGREASSAYGALINQVRNAQFGSALTEAEIAAFNKAYGSDQDQTTVLLTGLKEIADMTYQKFAAVAMLNNDVVIKARTGYNPEELENIMLNLQNRIAFYSAVENGTPVRQAAKQFGVSERGYAVEPDTYLAPPKPSQPTATRPSASAILFGE